MTVKQPKGARDAFQLAGPRHALLLWGLGTLCAMVACASSCNAQTAGLTLEGAIRGALRNENYAVQIQNENVNGAAARVKQAAGAFDWNVGAQGGLQLLYTGKVVNGVLTNQVVTTSTYYYNVNIGREFRNGISIAPGFIAFPGAGANAAQTAGFTQARPSLGLKIPVLRGFGEDSADAAERAAKDALAGARFSRSYALDQLVMNVAQLYWQCAAADRIARTVEAANKNGEAYEATLQKILQKGLIEPITVKQWVVANSSRQVNVQKTHDDALSCHRNLAYAVTGSSNTPVEIQPDALPQVKVWAPAIDRIDTSALVQLALDNRPDLQAAQKSVEATAETLKSAHDSTNPQLDFHIDPDRAIVLYTQSLQNNLGRGTEEAASAAHRQAELALLQLQDQIRTDITDVVQDLQRTASAWQALSSSAQALDEIAAESKKRAQFGSIGWSDLLAMEDQLLETQTQMIQAELQFASSLATLRLATGTIDTDTQSPSLIAAALASLPPPTQGRSH